MNGFRSSLRILALIIVFFQLNFFFSCSLNDEGIALLKFRERVVRDPFGVLSSWKEEDGETKHCSWFGIECADGHVVSLDLRNSRLEGTLSPELHHLVHIKSIILRNNSFGGAIPEEIRDLKELMLLDLGYNDFTEPLPPEFGHYIPILLLDHNGQSSHISPEVEEHIMHSKARVDDNQLTCDLQSLPYNRHNGWGRHAMPLRMLAEQTIEGAPNSSPTENFLSIPKRHIRKTQPPSPPAHPPRRRDPRGDPPLQPPPPPPLPSALLPPPSSVALSPPPPSVPAASNKESEIKTVIVVLGAVAGLIVVVLVIGAIYLWRGSKIIKVTGLTGPLQKAFITGISNLKRSELVIACEDFSNVIGSSSMGIIYKGTLSSGIEIAVISLAVTSVKDWSQHLEMQFRRKVETLSKVNHKNFINLIGYCEEENPFTRMMVFEYAPNGTLFEHLHVREAEHLDWGMRLRVMMGMAYCLEHMHQMVPPTTHPNFDASAVHLSEDYAAKISEFCLWNQVAAAQVQPTVTDSLRPSSAAPDSNVYNFGLVLMEMMTGRAPPSLENSSLEVEGWVLDYLRGERPLEELIDPMLRYFNPGQLEKISEVIRECLQPEPQQRPTMRGVAIRLREITDIDRDKAAPRLCPLWWEELEVLSVS